MSYLLIDFDSRWASNAISLTEIEIYDKEGEKIPYEIKGAYDSVTKREPHYWDNAIWSKKNINNGNLAYASNFEGRQSSCIFCLSQNGSLMNAWARLVIDIKDYEAANIKIYLGSPEGRIPKTTKIYRTKTITTNHLNEVRSIEGLELIQELLLPNTELRVKAHTILLSIKMYLLRDEEGLKTIGVNNQLVTVNGTVSTELFLNEGFSSLENIPSYYLNKELGDRELLVYSDADISMNLKVNSYKTLYNETNRSYEGKGKLILDLSDIPDGAQKIMLICEGKNLEFYEFLLTDKQNKNRLNCTYSEGNYICELTINNQSMFKSRTEENKYTILLDMNADSVMNAYSYSWI